jgi:hypothetical protein
VPVAPRSADSRPERSRVASQVAEVSATVRTGLFRIAMPVGALVGVATGVVAGWWAHRGGTWTVDDGGDRYSTR